MEPEITTNGRFSPATSSGDITQNNYGCPCADSPELLAQRVAHLEALLAEKERTIRILLACGKPELLTNLLTNQPIQITTI